MAYDGKLMRRAMARFEEAKSRRAEDLRARERAVYAAIPRVAEIDALLRATMSKLVASALRRGTDPRPAIEALREENLALQRERAALLTAHGYPADYLEDKPACPHCKDTGWWGNEVCACLNDYYARVQLEELSQLLDMENRAFEDFELGYYSPERDAELGVAPRAQMAKVKEYCVRYARTFSAASGSLLFSGDPGLGKTFLSACIAREVSETGHSVVYDTAQHVFSRFESQKFSGDEAAGEDVQRTLRCDLLIVDDLGAELTTEFVRSALYQIVNTRLLARKSTIISTNIKPDDLEKRYGAAVASRIAGEYKLLAFVGEDIRKQRR